VSEMNEIVITVSQPGPTIDFSWALLRAAECAAISFIFQTARFLRKLELIATNPIHFIIKFELRNFKIQIDLARYSN
jgi:hypothetical protein